MYLQNIQDYKTLNQNEKEYKQLYIEHPELQLEEPHTFHDISRIISTYTKVKTIGNISKNTPIDATIPEVYYFTDQSDVDTNCHERYCPCFIHSHSFFELCYVLKGSCTNYLPDHTYVMHEGDLALISLNTPHAISAFDDDTILINIMLRASTFQKAFFGILSQNDIISSFFSKALYAPDNTSYLLFHTKKDPKIQDLVMEVHYEVLQNKRYSEQLRILLVSELFVQLLRNHQQDLLVPNPSGSAPDQNIMFIINYIMSNYQTLSLKGLSAFFGYSERQMSRLLKDYTGKTFISIIQDIRIQQACQLLCNTHLPVQEIVETVGYSNSNHFYTVFKKYHGVTPAIYREKQLNHSSLK